MELSSRDSFTYNLPALLERFIAEWNATCAIRAGSGNTLKWMEFFDKWRKLPAQKFVATDNVVSTIEPSHLARFAETFSSQFEKYRQSGVMFNIWKTAQLGNDERKNCKVLAAFLDCTGDHGQGAAVFCRLLSAIGLSSFSESAKKCRYYTRTEVWPLADPESRVDVEIEGDDFLIFIEAKITADEGEDQLQRYLELARLKAAGRDWAVIYLTSDGRDAANRNLPDIVRIKPASWSQVSRAVRSCVAECSNNMVNYILLQYADFLGSLG
jgi:hypothetical protein